MLTKFKEILFKDFGWKLLSIAIATILWFMVINIDQPIDTRAYHRILSIENMEVLTERGLTIGNLEELKNTKVTVKVKAQRTVLDRLNQNPEWLQASVDLSSLTYAVNGDIIALPVDVSIQGSNAYTIQSKNPAVMEITVETLISKEFPVEVTLDGTLEDGVYLSEPILSTETVLVSGPASLVDRVASVRINVDAETIHATPEVRADLICYDIHGVAIKGLITSEEDILISYALHDAKQVPIQVGITGTPANGYQVDNIYCSPQYALVTGPAEELEKITFLQLDNIDVSNRSSSVIQSFLLTDYLPEGISLAGESENIAEVTVGILAQTQKHLTFSGDKLTILGQEDGKTYTVRGNAYISITGENLDHIRTSDIHGTIYVNGLSEGEHKVLIHADLPEGVTLNPSYITVTVGAENASENE